MPRLKPWNGKGLLVLIVNHVLDKIRYESNKFHIHSTHMSEQVARRGLTRWIALRSCHSNVLFFCLVSHSDRNRQQQNKKSVTCRLNLKCYFFICFKNAYVKQKLQLPVSDASTVSKCVHFSSLILETVYFLPVVQNQARPQLGSNSAKKKAYFFRRCL